MDEFEEFAALVDEIETIPEARFLDEDGMIDYYYKNRSQIPADHEADEELEAEAALSFYINILRYKVTLSPGNITAASEFLALLIRRNHVVAQKLTFFLAKTYIKKADGQKRSEWNILKAYDLFHSEELAHLGAMQRREQIATAFNVTAPSIANWIEAAEWIVKDRDEKRFYQMMDELEANAEDEYF